LQVNGGGGRRRKGVEIAAPFVAAMLVVFCRDEEVGDGVPHVNALAIAPKAEHPGIGAGAKWQIRKLVDEFDDARLKFKIVGGPAPNDLAVGL
jgi:hypothetical protein